jgi:hypothetical protein
LANAVHLNNDTIVLVGMVSEWIGREARHQSLRRRGGV